MKKKILPVLLTFASLIFSVFNSIAQWQPLNGPFGGNIENMAVIGTKIYACNYSAGLYVSTNNGADWNLVNVAAAANNIKCIAMNGANIFVGIDSRVFLSSNNGLNWTNVSTGLPTNAINKLINIGSYLLAGTEGGGIFLSLNNGTSWTAINNGLTNLNISSLLVSGTNIYAGTNGGGIFLSQNNGSSWTQINNGLTSVGIFSLAQVGTNIFAGTGNGIFITSDNGTLWTAAGLPNARINVIVSAGTNIYAGTNSGIFTSANNGTTWNALNTGLPLTDIRTIIFNGSDLLAGTGGKGVFVSTNNGLGWNAINNGLNGIHFNSLLLKNTNIFAGTGEGIFLSQDNGITWNPATNGLTNTNINSLTIIGGNIFAATMGGLFTSSNDGTTWNAANTGLTSQYVYAIVQLNSKIFAGTNGGVFVSSDNGVTWTASNTGLTNLQINCMTVNGSKIYAGTGGNGIFVSSDNGTSWSATNNGLNNLIITSLGVSGNFTLAGTKGSNIYASITGTTWTLANTPVPFSVVTSFQTMGNRTIAGTENDGIYLSLTNGANWTAISNGLLRQNIFSLTANSTTMYAGTHCGGIWIRSITDLQPPDSASVPTGLANLCQAQLGIAYSVAPIANASTYVWNLTPLNAGSVIGNGANVIINWNNLFTGQAQLTVQGRNEMGDGLVSPPLIINVNTGPKIHGNLVYTGGPIANGDAMIKLIKKGINGKHAVKESTLVGANGAFVLQNFPPGIYYMKINMLNFGPYPRVRNSFFDSTFKWFNAKVVNIPCSFDTNITVHMFELHPHPTGHGHFKGKVRHRHSLGKATGEPIPGAEIYVELDPDDEPVANVTTDTSGSYSIAALDTGSYTMYVDYPGYPLVETYSVQVTGTDTLQTELNFYVDTTTADAGIYTSTTSAVIHQSLQKFEVKLYPNPVKNKLTIEAFDAEEKMDFEIINILGKLIYSSSFTKQTVVDTENFPKGIYIIRLHNNKSRITKRFVKQ